MFSLIFTWINGWVNNRNAGDLRRHRAHYCVTVMHKFPMHSVFQPAWYRRMLYHGCINVHDLSATYIIISHDSGFVLFRAALRMNIKNVVWIVDYMPMHWYLRLYLTHHTFINANPEPSALPLKAKGCVIDCALRLKLTNLWNISIRARNYGICHKDNWSFCIVRIQLLTHTPDRWHTTHDTFLLRGSWNLIWHTD